MESCPIKLLMLVFQAFFHGSSQFMSCVGGNEAFTASFCCWVSVLCAILFWKKNDKLLRTSHTSGLAQHWESPCLVEDELITSSAPHSLSSAVKLLQWRSRRPPRPHICLPLVYLLGPGLSFSYLIFKHDPFCLLRHTGPSSAQFPGFLAREWCLQCFPSRWLLKPGTLYIFYFWLCCAPDSHMARFDPDVCRVLHMLCLSKNVSS